MCSLIGKMNFTNFHDSTYAITILDPSIKNGIIQKRGWNRRLNMNNLPQRFFKGLLVHWIQRRKFVVHIFVLVYLYWNNKVIICCLYVHTYLCSTIIYRNFYNFRNFSLVLFSHRNLILGWMLFNRQFSEERSKSIAIPVFK